MIGNATKALRQALSELSDAAAEMKLDSKELGVVRDGIGSLVTGAETLEIPPETSVSQVRSEGANWARKLAKISSELGQIQADHDRRRDALTGIETELRVASELIGKIVSIDDLNASFKKIEPQLEQLATLAKAGEKPKMVEYYKNVLTEAAEIGTELKVKAFFWAEVHVSAAPQEREVRIAMANFANLAAEYGNQLASRSDALILQLVDGKHRRALPLSVKLREAEPTDFLNLYTWNRAVAPALWEDVLYHPIRSFSSEETADRVRVIERLFADHNWGRINTVYASGQGDVSMAFVKDDIGNWNLKSFDNDPSEIVQAYTDVTLAGFGFAKRALLQAGTGGGASSIGQALKVASGLARGQLGSQEARTGGLNVTTMHARAGNKLSNLKTSAATKLTALNETRQAALKKASEDNTAKGKASAAVESGSSNANTPPTTPSKTTDMAEAARTSADQALNDAIEAKFGAEGLKETEDVKLAKAAAAEATRLAGEASNKSKTAMQEFEAAKQEADAKDKV